MNQFEFSTVPKIVCKPGAISSLCEYCEGLGIRAPMLVSDAGLVDAGVVGLAIASLDKAGIKALVYTDVEADPSEKTVLNSIAIAREGRVDGVIGVGGGSSLDVAKLIAALTQSEQTLADVYGVGNVLGQRLPLILVPTTAGTGSEATSISIVTTGATTKSGVVSEKLLPDIAVLDAELTLGLPPHVTAATGIDAMVHAIEAYTSKVKKNSYSDMLARHALTLLSAHIVEAVQHGANLDARGAMLYGACLAGQAFANAPVAGVHALAYPLGGNYHIPHGLSNSLVLPHVLRFNAPKANALYAELLPCVMPDANYSNADDACSQFIQYIEGLIAAVKLPTKLSELAVPECDLAMLADEAMQQQRLLVNNPRELNRRDALAIYRSAY